VVGIRRDRMKDILDACVSAIREYTMQKGHEKVTQTLEYLKATREKFPLVVSDRGWLFRFIVYRPDLRWKSDASAYLSDAFIQGDITEQDIWQWIDDALSMVPIQELPALPERADGDPWCAVMVEEKLYCCGCRSLFEGSPLTMSQAYYLRDERETFCTECGSDL
jgi:hypothetical protein